MILRELFSLSHRNLNASHQAKPTCEAAHCADVTTSGTSGIYKHIQTRIDARVCICNGTVLGKNICLNYWSACHKHVVFSVESECFEPENVWTKVHERVENIPITIIKLVFWMILFSYCSETHE